MRRTLFALAVLAATVLTAVPPASAAVPDASYTETGCDGHSDAVARLYVAAFGRTPEIDGFNFWVDAYATAQWSLPDMADFFVESAEFEDRFGAVDDSGFVTQLYANVLDRAPDGAGLAFWIGELAGGLERWELLLRFSESPENIERSGTTAPILGPFNIGTTLPFDCDNPDVIELCNAYLVYLSAFDLTDLIVALGTDAPSGVLAALDTLQDPDAFFEDILAAADILRGYVTPVCRDRWDQGLEPGGIDADVVDFFFTVLVAGEEVEATTIAPDDVRALFSPWTPIEDDPDLGPPSYFYDGSDMFFMVLGSTITVACDIDDGIVTSCGFGE